MKEERNHRKHPVIPYFLCWLFPYKRKGLSINTQSAAAYYLFQNKISLTLINWLFQGIRGMGVADRIGKGILDILFFCFFLLLLDDIRTGKVVIAIALAHTLNWLINSHFWDFGRFIGITRTSPGRFFPYIKKIMYRIIKTKAVHAVIVIGGISRNAGFRETSDVDMIFIKEKGIINTINAVVIAVRERTMAFFLKFPLHLELYDSVESMKQFRSDELPVLLKDDKGEAESWYKKAGRATGKPGDFKI